MIFKELETKERFSNRFGNSSYIHSYCYYEGTEQISIYVKTGYGASEKTINEVISEHKLDEWITEFTKIKIPKETKNNINLSWVKPKEIEEKQISKPIKIEKMSEEKNDVIEVQVQKNDYARMRNIIFDTMIGVNDGSIDVEKAKVIATLSQTLINSVKTENDFLKITGEKKLQSMIN